MHFLSNDIVYILLQDIQNDTLQNFFIICRQRNALVKIYNKKIFLIQFIFFFYHYPIRRCLAWKKTFPENVFQFSRFGSVKIFLKYSLGKQVLSK